MNLVGFLLVAGAYAMVHVTGRMLIDALFAIVRGPRA